MTRLRIRKKSTYIGVTQGLDLLVSGMVLMLVNQTRPNHAICKISTGLIRVMDPCLTQKLKLIG